MRVVELFGGIGAFRKALFNLNINHKVIDYVEIDKNCVKSYNNLYDENFKAKSIVGYSLPNEEIDILIHGSPCQDFSLIGLRKGGEENSNTRSSLLFETIRIVNQATYKPKWIIWENVKNVLNNENRLVLNKYLNYLNQLGYESKFQVLNAMDFKIPQKRERLFVISCLNENKFNFKNLKKTNFLSIKHYLEKQVDDKYIVSQNSIVNKININQDSRFHHRSLFFIKDYCLTITTKQMRVPNSGFLKYKHFYRYLTERECFRLMGFDDKDFDKLKEIFAKKDNKMSSILYKQAGNSIVVPILMEIIKEIINCHQNQNSSNKQINEMFNNFIKE